MRYRFLAIVPVLLLIALSFASVGCPAPCECGEWVGSITVSAGAWQETVECGDTVYVPDGIGAVVVSADYLCEPGNCGTDYQWLVSAPVSMNGTSDVSPCVFQFEVPEEECVTVRISAFCGDTRCADCSFTVCPGEEEECDCGQWGEITVSAGDWLEAGECGGTVFAPPGFGAAVVSAEYICEPPNCLPTYEWQVSAAVAVIASGTCDVSPCLFQFEIETCVEVSISAYCGDTLCDTCTFTICPAEECDCGQWEGINVSWGTTQGTTAACGQSIDIPPDVGMVGISASYPCDPPECQAIYEWTVSTAAAVLDSGVSTNGLCDFQFELPYECVTVSISIFCGENLCETCTFTICPYIQPGGGGQPPGAAPPGN